MSFSPVSWQRGSGKPMFCLANELLHVFHICVQICWRVIHIHFTGIILGWSFFDGWISHDLSPLDYSNIFQVLLGTKSKFFQWQIRFLHHFWINRINFKSCPTWKVLPFIGIVTQNVNQPLTLRFVRQLERSRIFKDGFIQVKKSSWPIQIMMLSKKWRDFQMLAIKIIILKYTGTYQNLKYYLFPLFEDSSKYSIQIILSSPGWQYPYNYYSWGYIDKSPVTSINPTSIWCTTMMIYQLWQHMSQS